MKGSLIWLLLGAWSSCTMADEAPRQGPVAREGSRGEVEPTQSPVNQSAMPDEECLRSVLLRRYGWRDDVAVVEVKIDRIGRDYIRTGLISAVKSEFIDATVLRIVAVDKSFDTRVPRRQLEPSKVIDLINKPVDARGVPLDTLRTGSSYLVAILRPGRKGFFLVDAVPLKSAP